MLSRRILLVTVPWLAGCTPNGNAQFHAFFDRLFHRAPPPPPPVTRYVVGAGYPAGGMWYYPREDFSYDMTGLGAVQAGPHDRLTADGELYDPAAMAAAHQTLQLPAIIRVTNLENGRQALLRLNDRGPADPARFLAVTPRAAQLLGFDADGTARLRVQVESAPSQALAAALHGNTLAIETAPLAKVQAESLPPPPGARGVTRAAVAGPAAPAEEAAAVVPDRLPEQVIQMPASPGTLWIEAGRFGRAEYANRRAAQLAGTGAGVGRVSSGGQTSYTVRIGPLGSVAEADRTLREVIADGVIDARIEVE